ncbi:hypothetical protein FYJ27_05330 [Anaerosalibacter bizertensis]|uniref:Uncharacterized protein n=1 Tax=Anaerosalibacter bizertensis TaxID=932217 RepID=A0A844FGH3_9FIRM|nr:hypothetical protein [Anaerosalibacter bizertensis]MSS43153.1 hypothetical protein [Anaerosalibacter bizertensis]
MRKKVIILITSLLIVTTLLSACGNSKYKVSSDSELTKEDMKILQKNFSNLTEDEEIKLATMSFNMTEDEYIKFKDDLKRLHAEEMVSKGLMTKERADKLFEESYDYELRKKQGKLTEEEKKEDKEREKAAEEFNNEVAKYSAAKDKIQENLNNNLENKYDGYIIKSEVIDTDSVSNKVIIDTDVMTTKDITVGQMTTIRNEIAQEVDEVIEVDRIEISLKLNSEDKGTYTFTKHKGWDKDIQP